jgi:FtsH-binding integral membrane protein
MQAVKKHPFVAVFLLGWVLGVPAALMKESSRDPLNLAAYSLGAGLLAIIVGWITLYNKRNDDPETRFRSGLIAASWAAIILLGLAIYGWSKQH